MNKEAFRGLLLIFACCCLTHCLFADQVTLKNGDRYSGTIINSDAKTLTLKTDYAGTVTIQWSAIAAVKSAEPLYVTSKGGQVTVGPVSTTDGKLEVQTTESGPVMVPKDDVVTMRSKEEQAAFEAQTERLLHPHLLDYWSGSVDSGLALTRGNSETTTFNLGINAARTTSRDKISIYSTALFAKGKVAGVCGAPAGKATPASCVVTTASAVRGGTRYDFNLSDRTFAFGQLDLEHDRFQELDLRTVLAGGFGYHAIKTDRTTLDLLGGGSFNHEAFSTGLTRSAGEILLGDNLAYKLTKSTSLIQDLQFFPNLSDPGEYRFAFDAGVVTALSRWLSWQVTYSERFLSNPPLGIKRNDVLLTTGIHLTFGHAAK